MNNAEKTVRHLLTFANIKINGGRPQDIQIRDKRFYAKVLRTQSLGLGESYVDGWWDCRAVDAMITKLYEAKVSEKISITPFMIGFGLAGKLVNFQSRTKARQNASAHYDIGNDLYERMLDKRMIYSCGYWKNTMSLDAAQEAKLDLICQKLHLKSGMKLLDIGCGWGGFAKYAATKYGVNVTGVTPATEQVKLAKERTRGLPVTILQQDYREVTGSFDRIVSIGMMEHVGPKNYSTFFKQCEKLLEPGGLMLHHTLGSNHSTFVGNPWTDKYIFPGGVLPSLAQISKAVERRFIIEDVHNFGPDYDKTLLAWRANFVKSYPAIQDHYDKRFYRMWEFYLLSFAGAIRSRELQLWQIVMRKIETSATYVAVR